MLDRPLLTGSQTNIKFFVVGHEKLKNILLLAIFANLWTFVMTVIPVGTDLPPDNYYANHPNWYTGDDVVRYLEPALGFPMNYAIIYWYECRGASLSFPFALLFMFFGTIYVQGAAFHSASVMYKNSLRSVMAEHDDDVVRDNYYWIRTVWEHEVSHYMYGIGLCCLFALQQWAYKDVFYCGGSDGSATSNEFELSAHTDSSILAGSSAAPKQNKEGTAAASDAASIEEESRCGSSSGNEVAALSPMSGSLPASAAADDERSAAVSTHGTRGTPTPPGVVVIQRLIYVAAFSHALVIAAASIDFPSGLIVGSLYVLLGLAASLWYYMHSMLLHDGGTGGDWIPHFALLHHRVARADTAASMADAEGGGGQKRISGSRRGPIPLTTAAEIVHACCGELWTAVHHRPLMSYFTWGFIDSALLLLLWMLIYGAKSRSQAGVL